MYRKKETTILPLHTLYILIIVVRRIGHSLRTHLMWFLLYHTHTQPANKGQVERQRKRERELKTGCGRGLEVDA
jgi:hypothetical protein